MILAPLLLLAQTSSPVIVIGVDGFGAAGYRAARDAGVIPHLEELRRRAAWTLKARAVIPTVSSPNWASAIMGAGPEWHGITSNDWQPDKFEIAPGCVGDTPGRFPTLFGLLRAQRPGIRTAVIHDWEGFGRLVEPGAPHSLQHVKGGSEATAAFAIDYWKKVRPGLLFIHLDDVDHAGHQHGWDSAAYQKALAEHDTLIGRLVAVVREAKPTIVFIADHGGQGKKHGGSTMAEIEIPWMIAGPGIKPGEIAGPVNIQDTAATLAALYRLRTPACWDAKAVGLR